MTLVLYQYINIVIKNTINYLLYYVISINIKANCSIPGPTFVAIHPGKVWGGSREAAKVGREETNCLADRWIAKLDQEQAPHVAERLSEEARRADKGRGAEDSWRAQWTWLLEAEGWAQVHSRELEEREGH